MYILNYVKFQGPIRCPSGDVKMNVESEARGEDKAGDRISELSHLNGI